MMPVLFRIPWLNRDIPGYGVMMMVGFMVGIIWAARRAARSRADPDLVLNCGFIALIAGVVGCRAMYVIHYWDQFKARGDAWQVFWAVIDVTKGGLEFYGGFLLTALAIVIYLHWIKKVSLRWYLDILAPSAVIGLAFGRIGCFLNGCCWGGVSDLPWAVRFPYGSNALLQQWQDKLPGAGLREELIFIYRDERNGVSVTQPIGREILTVPPREIAKAAAREAALRGQLAEARARRDGARDPARQQQLGKQVERLTARLRSAQARYADIRAQMAKYHLSFAELRRLAAARRSLPVHPTQLYSAVTAFLLAFLLSAVYWRRTRDGQVVCTLFLIQPLARWLIEVVRVDNPVDTLGFTVSQFLALCMTLVGLAGLLVLRRLPRRSPRARPWEPPAPRRAAARGAAPAA